MSKNGKLRIRNVRANLLRCDAANARRRARRYDRQEYDKPQNEES